MQAWLTKLLISAFLAALQAGRKKGYGYMWRKAYAWREHCRDHWWRYKLKTILSQQDPDDDMLADGLGRFFKFRDAAGVQSLGPGG